MLARFYGPFQSCPGLNTASCWPHGRNVVPCPSGEENRRRIGGRRGGGGDAWICAKKVLPRPQTYVAMWRQAAQGERRKMLRILVFLSRCFDISRALLQNQKPLNAALLTWESCPLSLLTPRYRCHNNFSIKTSSQPLCDANVFIYTHKNAGFCIKIPPQMTTIYPHIKSVFTDFEIKIRL